VSRPGRLVRAKGLPGAILYRWEPPVPWMSYEMQEAAIFLYPTREQAEKRLDGIGTGFLVAVDSEAQPTATHLYAVSNDHVSRRAPVIRVAPKREADVEIIDGTDADWIEHPDGDDVAVRPLGVVRNPPGPASVRRYAYMEASRLISTEDIRWGAGPTVGDECLMVSRYVNHKGEQFDRPVVRFGNLSMYPEPVLQKERTFDQESFLVDMRSVPGFSGSVVLIYFTEPGVVSMTEPLGGGQWPTGPDNPAREIISKWWVLGIDWGHLPVSQKIWEDGQAKRVKAESNMAGVVPAWKLTELLTEVEAVVKPREKAEADLAKANPDAAELDSANPEYERFEDLTRQIVKVPKADIDQQRKKDD
jgi:hypothetical protein